MVQANRSGYRFPVIRSANLAMAIGLGVTMMLPGCATKTVLTEPAPQPESIPHKEFVVSSGAFGCNVRADDPNLQFDERIESDHQRAVFRIPGGSYRSIERFQLGRHSLTEWPNSEINERRLIQTIKLYVARVLIPNFELVEVVEAFTYTLDGQQMRYVVLNIQQAEHSQHHAFLFFFTPEFFNVMHYSNALVFDGSLLRRVMDEFYGQCHFADRSAAAAAKGGMVEPPANGGSASPRVPSSQGE